METQAEVQEVTKQECTKSMSEISTSAKALEQTTEPTVSLQTKELTQLLKFRMDHGENSNQELVGQHQHSLLHLCWSRIRGSNSAGGGSTSGSSYKTGTYKVVVAELNIRKGPEANYGTNGSIKDKGVYTITEIQNGSWGRLKSGAGWINVDKAYCTYKGAATSSSGGSSSSGSFQVQVSISDLYIRKGPGTNYGKNGFCPKGVYTIVETKSAGGYTWGRLKSGAGWIAPGVC